MDTPAGEQVLRLYPRAHLHRRTHERLVSLLRTAAEQGADAMAIFGELLRSPVPIVAPLAILTPRAP